MKKLLAAAAFAAGLTAVSAAPAAAYPIRIEFHGCQDNAVAHFQFHTVSSVCHNVQGWGVKANEGAVWSGSTASICLVDRVDVHIDQPGSQWDSSINTTWKGAGTFGGSFAVMCNQDGVPVILCNVSSGKPCAMEDLESD
jgi:hypothetical protein